ncbi:hypothetical protein CAPTEDRAFT_190864 [Capitella teleta]|uniref:Tyrosine-protein phosphatase domain-containing protein n=1 Tax=Capitella teleta TaxID=283909 RepID=R7VK37_CAPTE|nr:hypothetical protein CAPTEDRAFT_190864 [Capitella teleta]|eukprot:ELU16445.1 hypothetical protein CAPTEDRAFT_190864 [Capitella teleta]
METNEYEELQDLSRGTNESSTSHSEQKSVEVTSTGSVWNAVLSLFKLKGWSFFAFKCPKGRYAVRQFWRLMEDREIQNVVLLEDVSSKVNISRDIVDQEYLLICCHRGISVLTLDHELTNKAIISLRQNLIPNGRSPKCAIMCNDGQQLSGFFIGVNCMLDMVDKGNKINCMYGLTKFRTVCPEFEPSEEQLLQLSQLSKDYISYGKKSK